MAIEVDASTLIAAFADFGERGEWAQNAIEGQDLYSPSHLFVECAHGIRRMERDGDLTTFEALVAFQSMQSLAIELHPFEPYSERIWALRHNVTPYDAWYVAMAEALGCPLVTFDRRLSRVSGIECEVITLQP